jgi:putative tricarboxylic transport membrane protein
VTATAPHATHATVSTPSSGRKVNWPKLTFLGVLLVVFAVYTEMAMGMEWRTHAGRIGPGFFPRILGFTAIAVTIAAAVREILSRPKSKTVTQAEAADEAAESDLGRHPLALVAFIAAAAVFVALFGVLGAALAGVLFLGVTLWFLDPEHHIRAVIIAVAVPVLLYLAFQIGLNAGLPQGILPFS